MGATVTSPIHPRDSLCFSVRWRKTRGQHNHSLNFNLDRPNVSWDVLNSVLKLLFLLHKEDDTPQVGRFSGALREPYLKSQPPLKSQPTCKLYHGLQWHPFSPQPLGHTWIINLEIVSSWDSHWHRPRMLFLKKKPTTPRLQISCYSSRAGLTVSMEWAGKGLELGGGWGAPVESSKRQGRVCSEGAESQRAQAWGSAPWHPSTSLRLSIVSLVLPKEMIGASPPAWHSGKQQALCCRGEDEECTSPTACSGNCFTAQSSHGFILWHPTWI